MNVGPSTDGEWHFGVVAINSGQLAKRNRFKRYESKQTYSVSISAVTWLNHKGIL
jgi:hypothetical protein